MSKERLGVSVEVKGITYSSVKRAMEGNGLRYNSAVYESFMRDTGMHFKTAILSDRRLVEDWLGRYIDKRKTKGSNRKIVPVTVFGKEYKSKRSAYMELKPNCSYEKFLVEIRKYDCDEGKAIEKLMVEDRENLKK